MKRHGIIILAIAVLVCCGVVSFAQEEQAVPSVAVQGDEEGVVNGVVEEIAEDGSYIVVSGTKLLATKAFLDDSYLEVGDKVEITTKQTEQGLTAANYTYLFDGEPAGAEESVGENSSEDTSSTEGIDVPPTGSEQVIPELQE